MENVTQVSTNDSIDRVINQAIQYKASGASNTRIFNYLTDNGVPNEEAKLFINKLNKDFTRHKKSEAFKDIFFGFLWCVGGIVLTTANIGFIFWGAIVFGGIQFFKGLINLLSLD